MVSHKYKKKINNNLTRNYTYKIIYYNFYYETLCNICYHGFLNEIPI